MNNFKLWFTSILLIVCIGGGIYVYIQGKDNAVKKYALDTLKSEIKAIEDDNKELLQQKNSYLSSINKDKTEISDNENSSELKTYYSEIADYEAKNQQLDKDIENAKQEKESLSQYTVNLNGISNRATGESRILETGTYQCPADIAPGRYLMTGSGSFRIVSNAANRVTESQNLGSLDGNSYTLNIESETRVITDGTVVITPIE